MTALLNRVGTGPGKPGKSWNFIKSWKVLEICLTQLKNMKCMEGSKENLHYIGSVGVNVNFRALEKSI